MPYLFLSPSTQEYNSYINYGNEELWMNALADAMEPLLRASGVNVTRNDPEKTVSNSIRMSNEGNYGFHLALHSNAAPESLSGKLRGIDIYHYPGAAKALRMAHILQQNLEVIYPLPDQVEIVTSTSLAEIRDTRAPSLLLELGYHDNLEDAQWLQNNLGEIARSLTEGVTEYFGIPFLLPHQEHPARAIQSSGNLNLRGGPGTSFPILAKIPMGAALTVINAYDGWYVVDYNGILGYASSQFVKLDSQDLS